MKNIAIFASGGGSNAQKIIDYFEEVTDIQVSVIYSSKVSAGIVQRAENHGIPCRILTREKFYESEDILGELRNFSIDLVVLAGFLWLVPVYLIRSYPDKILNIHPALLPDYGGKGMYGMHVHRAVKANHEAFSGMTIHLVNEEYDKGRAIFQASCQLSPEDSPEEIASRVLQLEHKYYPKVIHYLLSQESETM